MSHNIGDKYFDEDGNEFEVVDVKTEIKEDGTIITIENSIKV